MDGQGPPRRGHRGDPRRRLQPHGRGQPPRSRSCPSRASTTRRTTGSSTATSASTTTPRAPGNSLNMRHPHVLQLIMDSLRYWVTEMHVDGFRFDLASTLARQFHEVDRLSAFFDLIQQDPVVSRVKLIAEPWDIGEGGYQVGNFPPLWSEWNGKYRDTLRDYWRGEPQTLGEFASRLTGQLRPLRGRRPPAVREHQLRHRARRLHARRPRLLQREAQRGQRRGRRATARATTARGTRASRARPTTPRCSSSARASGATSSRRCSSRRASRCCSAATRSAAPRAATTTPTARTTRSRGSTGTTRTARCWRSRSG